MKEEKLAKTLPKIAICSLQNVSLRRDNYAEIQTWAVNSLGYRDWLVLSLARSLSLYFPENKTGPYTVSVAKGTYFFTCIAA